MLTFADSDHDCCHKHDDLNIISVTAASDAAVTTVTCILASASTMTFHCTGYFANSAPEIDCGPPLPYAVPAVCPQEWKQGQGRQGGEGRGCRGRHDSDCRP